MTRILLILLALAVTAPADVRAQATAEDSVRAVVVQMFVGSPGTELEFAL